MQETMELISSDLTEEKLAEELNNRFLANPQLLNATMIGGRSIFHILIIKNKAEVLRILFKNPEFKSSAATKVDKAGHTLLHIAAIQSSTKQKCLELIIKHFPEQLNIKNKAGNTPLFEAVRCNEVWAVKQLVKYNIDLSVKNNQGLNILELTGTNQDVIKALLFINMDSINMQKFKPPLSTPAKASPKESQDLSKTSSPLPSGRSDDNLSSPESLDSLSSSSRLERLSNLSSSRSYDSVTNETSEPENTGASIDLIFEKLLSTSKNSSKSEGYILLEKQFLSLSQTLKMSDKDFPWLVNRAVSSIKIHQVLQRLSPLVNDQFNAIQSKNNEDFKALTRLIDCYGLSDDSRGDTPTILNFKKIAKVANEKETGLLEVLWLMTTGRISSEQKPAIGLLNDFTTQQVLDGIKKLYPFLDNNQKILANYLVWEITLFHLSTGEKLTYQLMKPLNFLIKNNVKKTIGEEQLWPTINLLTKELMERNTEFYKQPLFVNHTLLKKWYTQLSAQESKLSFVELVNKALGKKSHKRSAEIDLIANELKLLTLDFYQHVSNYGFTTDARRALLTNQFNKLNNFMTYTILNKHPKKMTNHLQFLAQLTRALRGVKDNQYLDLNSLMLISSIFNCTSISRLTYASESLTQEDKQVIEELQKIVSRDKNCKQMRELCQINKAALPFPGVILTDLVFAVDGNKNPIEKANVLGELYSQIGEIKSRLPFNVFRHETDLPQWLENYSLVDDMDLFKASYKIQQPTCDVTKGVTKWCIALSNLYDSHLINDLYPTLIYKTKIYKPLELIDKLLEDFENLETRSKDDIDILNITIIKLVHIYNHHHKEAKEHLINPIPFLHKAFLIEKKQIANQNKTESCKVQINTGSKRYMLFTHFEKQVDARNAKLQELKLT